MEIRKIEQKDLPQLCALYDQLVPGDGNFEAICRGFECVRDNPDFLLVGVFEEDRLIATASLTRCFDLTGDARFYYSMENFIVDEHHRRKGVGSMLMEYLESYVESRNGRYINFTSSAFRTEAHLFYAKMGYLPDYVKGFKKTFAAREEEILS